MFLGENIYTFTGTFPVEMRVKGRLIIFEGLDGAGKSTQIELLSQYLRNKGYPVVVTSWTSSRLISKAIKRAKKAQLLSPYLYSILHAADFLYRLENIVAPALAEGYIVIADRYAFTGLARDVARDVDPSWVRHLYAVAPEPDLAIYCSTPVEVSLSRILEKSGRMPGFYEAGMDVQPGNDPIQGYRTYQGKVAAAYGWISREYGLLEVDATRPIEELHGEIAASVEEQLRTWEGERIWGPGIGAPEPAPQMRGQRYGTEEAARTGLLFTVESANRAAASRQATFLYNELLVRGYRARLVLLGNSWISIEVARKAMRKTVVSDPVKALLSAAEMALYYEQVIQPALSNGEIVVTDCSSADLKAVFAESSVDANWLEGLLRVFRIRPDLTLFIDSSLQDLYAKQSLRSLLDVPGLPTDERMRNPGRQQAIVERYREAALLNEWQTLPDSAGQVSLHRSVMDMVADLLPRVQAGKSERALREVFALIGHHGGEFDHPRKVAELALRLFDQTKALHSLGERERFYLMYAAYLHDIGHSLSEARHEEFTYDIIMRWEFPGLREEEKHIIANIACLHRQPFARMKFDHLARLGAEHQLTVRKLAALLRIADALDESGKRVVRDVRCYEEHGVVYIDLLAVAKARPERAAVLRKADMFEQVYRKPVVVARNWLEKRARSAWRLKVFPAGESGI